MQCKNLKSCTREAFVLQANAEPDMKQTGERLKGIIATLVEGTLELALQLPVTRAVSP